MMRLQVLAVGLVGFVLSGCSLNAQQSGLSQSLATWKRLKAENGDHYLYETSFASWAGFGDKTTLAVRDEKVVARTYEAYRYDGGNGETEMTESWTEKGADVGSHEVGADPVTIDTLYEQCRTEVLTQNALENTLYLEFQNEGVLSLCQYAPKNCADDCSRGVRIDRLEFLKD